MVKNSFVTEVTFIILAFNQQNQLNEVNQHFRRIVLVVAQVHLPSWQVCYLGKAIPLYCYSLFPLLMFLSLWQILPLSLISKKPQGSLVGLQVWSTWIKFDIPIWHLFDWLMESFSSQLSSQSPNYGERSNFFLNLSLRIPFKVQLVHPQNLYYYHIYFGVQTPFSGNKYS